MAPVRWLLIVLVLVPWASIAASAAEGPSNHRLQFPRDGEVPNGFALRLLGDAVVQNFEMAMKLMTSYTDLSDEAATNLLMYIQRLNRTHVAERRNAEFELACSPVPQSDEKAIQVMSLLDDVRSAVDEKYYLIATGNLSAQEREALDSALQPFKRGTTVTLLNHKVLYANASPGTAVNHLAQFCAARGG